MTVIKKKVRKRLTKRLRKLVKKYGADAVGKLVAQALAPDAKTTTDGAATATALPSKPKLNHKARRPKSPSSVSI